MKAKFKLELNWHDRWIGVYDKKKLELTFGDTTFSCSGLFHDVIQTWYQHIWICIIPCLPIHIWWEIDPKEGRRGVIA